jgi:hypothetical protein
MSYAILRLLWSKIKREGMNKLEKKERKPHRKAIARLLLDQEADVLYHAKNRWNAHAGICGTGEKQLPLF